MCDFNKYISNCPINKCETYLGFSPEYQKVDAIKIDDMDVMKIEKLISSKTDGIKTIFKDSTTLRKYYDTGVMDNSDQSNICVYSIICAFETPSKYQISINYGDYLIWVNDYERFIVLPEFEFNLFYSRRR